MRIYTEMSMDEFKPWSGATTSYEMLDAYNAFDIFEEMIDDIFSEGIDETKLNDILWFDEQFIADCINSATGYIADEAGEEYDFWYEAWSHHKIEEEDIVSFAREWLSEEE